MLKKLKFEKENLGVVTMLYKINNGKCYFSNIKINNNMLSEDEIRMSYAYRDGVHYKGFKMENDLLTKFYEITNTNGRNDGVFFALPREIDSILEEDLAVDFFGGVFY